MNVFIVNNNEENLLLLTRIT